jgi:AcrR family transcriptional regulator
MPPTASSHEAKSAGPDDLGGLIEREHLPSGRRDLPQPLIARSQRERILYAMAQACAAKGFGAARIADIVQPAGVSRATFYELFADKEDCLDATMELSLADTMGRILKVRSPEKPWAARVRTTTAAILELLASRPDFARMALIEAPAAGGRSFEMYAAGKRVVESLLDHGRAESAIGAAVPASTARGALAAAESLIVGQILAGNTERLPELLPDIVYIVTVPYLGQDEALRQSHEAEKPLHSRAV